jgi:hypothetical protein
MTVRGRWYQIITDAILVPDALGIRFKQQQSWCAGTG